MYEVGDEWLSDSMIVDHHCQATRGRKVDHKMLDGQDCVDCVLPMLHSEILMCRDVPEAHLV